MQDVDPFDEQVFFAAPSSGKKLALFFRHRVNWASAIPGNAYDLLA
jgi:hypothetical protein